MGRLTALADTLTALRRPEELYELLDPDAMWYSADVDSNCTCNDRDDVIACIERNAAAGLTGRFDVLGEGDDVAVVQAVLDPPRPGDACLLLRFRDGGIVEMRDFASPQAAFLRRPRLERSDGAVSRSARICHSSSLTRHTFPGSLVGIGEGGGVPASSRVYMNCGGRP